MQYLGHYTSIDKLELILENLSFKFGCLENTNDPYENRNIFFSYRLPLMDGGKISTLSDYYYKNEKTKDKFYVQCCSFRNSRKELINKPRMWSQYANNHNGCCIILKKEEFDLKFKKLRHQQTDSSRIEYDLNKCREEIDIRSKNLSKFVNEKTQIDKIRDFIWDNREVYIFKKMEDWKEESEYRYLIYSSKTNDNIFIDISDSIESIVLGDKVSNFMRNAIWQYCKAKNISLSQVFWNNGYPVEQDAEYLIEMEEDNKILSENDLINN